MHIVGGLPYPARSNLSRPVLRVPGRNEKVEVVGLAFRRSNQCGCTRQQAGWGGVLASPPSLLPVPRLPPLSRCCMGILFSCRTCFTLPLPSARPGCACFPLPTPRPFFCLSCCLCLSAATCLKEVPTPCHALRLSPAEWYEAGSGAWAPAGALQMKCLAQPLLNILPRIFTSQAKSGIQNTQIQRETDLGTISGAYS